MHDELREALKLPDIPLRSKSAALRMKVPQIEEFLARGVPREVIVEEFKKQGHDVTVHGLSNFLSYERRTRKNAKLAQTPPPQAAPLVGAAIRATTGAPVQAPAVSAATHPPPPAAPAASQTTDGGLADVLDPKKRDAFADKYVNQKPRLFAAKPQGEN